MASVRASCAASELLMSPGVSESMRKLHEPCGARLVADVAHALLRAVSRLISTPALLFDMVCESCARTGRREESSLTWHGLGTGRRSSGIQLAHWCGR